MLFSSAASVAEELGDAGLHVAALAGLVGDGRALGEQPRGLGTGHHVGELDLDRLVLADRLAEGLALLGVAHGLVEAGLGHADAAGGDVDAAEFQPAQRVLQALALHAADELVGVHAVVLEGKLGGVDPAVAEFLELAAYAEALALIGEEEAHALVAGLGRQGRS